MKQPWSCRAARLWLSSQHSAHVTTARWRHKLVLWVRDLYRCPAFVIIIKALSKMNYSNDIQYYIIYQHWWQYNIEPCLNSWQYLIIKRDGTQLNGTKNTLKISKAYKNRSPLLYMLYIKINKIEKFNQHQIWCNLTKGVVST